MSVRSRAFTQGDHGDAALPQRALEVDVILLDQGKTFMFENDRFGPDVDYAATYRSLGGRELSDVALRRAVSDVFSYLLRLDRTLACAAAFPSIERAIAKLGLAVSREDVARIDELFAHHEVGTIAPIHAAVLRKLARTHRLGVVSNIWASPRRFLANLVAAGVHDCFEHLVWSSEHGCSKPAPYLFEHALMLFQVQPSQVLFVGDDALRDVDAAKSIGMRAAWVKRGQAEFPEGLRAPDVAIEDVSELPQVLSRRSP